MAQSGHSILSIVATQNDGWTPFRLSQIPAVIVDAIGVVPGLEERRCDDAISSKEFLDQLLRGRSRRAQQPAMPAIGFLNPTSPDTRRELIAAFHQGLAEAGYVEGQNLRSNIVGLRVNTIDWRGSPPVSPGSKSPSLLR